LPHIEELLALPYRREVLPLHGKWQARISEFPRCAVEAPTLREALEDLDTAFRAVLETAIQDKLALPTPLAENSYSGRFLIRTSKSLHQAAVIRANDEGVSLNRFVEAAIIQALNQPFGVWINVTHEKELVS
jgi:predicted RNase H-like HicB family nuclease